MNWRARVSPAALLSGRFSFWILIALATWFWAPALFQRRVVLHGDYAVYSLSLMRVLHRAVHEHESMLWLHNMTGGHPLFAEGQGGFANPLNLLAALLFEPVRALGVVQWLSLIASAGGVFRLCRLLEMSRWAATFAALSVGFSGSWIAIKDNLPVSATIAWSPWLMLAFECWWKSPGVGRAALMAVPAALMLLSGYPQIAYASLLYLIVCLFALLLSRDLSWPRARKLALTGTLAAVLAVGLASIQLLPLRELVPLSIRSAGVSLGFGGFIEPKRIVRGLFYFSVDGGDDAANVHSLASITVLMLLGLLLVVRPKPGVLRHLLAGLFVFNLGMGRASPLFELLYDNNLLPGIRSFRTVAQPYICVAIVGACIAAASALDQLAAERLDAWRWAKRWSIAAGASIVVYLCALGTVVWSALTPAFSPAFWLAPLAALVSYFLLRVRGWQRWMPLVAALCVVIDALALRMQPFTFEPPSVLAAPRMVQEIIHDPELGSYHVLSLTMADGMTLAMPARDPGLRAAYARVLKSLSYLPSMEWDVPTFNGQLALPLGRWKALESTLRLEGEGGGEKLVGPRLIDVLGFRYIAANSEARARGLRLFAQDGKGGMRIYKNHHAQPMFQLYGEAHAVQTQEAAIDGLRAAPRRQLFLEKAFTGEAPAPGPACDQALLTELPIQIASSKATRYRLDVDTPCDAWLFLADANYPGWEATVNGASRPVFTAQVLGKAVQLTAGHNRVELAYRPRSVYAGAAISACALLVLLALVLVPMRLTAARARTAARPAV